MVSPRCFAQFDIVAAFTVMFLDDPVPKSESYTQHDVNGEDSRSLAVPTMLLHVGVVALDFS